MTGDNNYSQSGYLAKVLCHLYDQKIQYKSCECMYSCIAMALLRSEHKTTFALQPIPIFQIKLYPFIVHVPLNSAHSYTGLLLNALDPITRSSQYIFYLIRPCLLHEDSRITESVLLQFSTGPVICSIMSLINLKLSILVHSTTVVYNLKPIFAG